MTLLLSAAACGSTTGATVATPNVDPPAAPQPGAAAAAQPPTRQSPPPSGPARDVRFPPIARSHLDNGLEINAVRTAALPVVYLRLVVRSGAETDPPQLPGLAHLVGQMLEEGTRTRTAAELAEAVEFLGADLWVEDNEETVTVAVRALAEHLDAAMELLADVVRNPRFAEDELRKLKERERSRLEMQLSQERFLARRELFAALYGEHPYARIDTTVEALGRVRRADLQRWHRTHFVPNNAFLVAVGAPEPEAVRAAAERHFATWRRGTVPEVRYPAPPSPDGRRIVLVHRAGSVQSLVLIGRLAVARADPDFVPLLVQNQVLGGSAASRLFMDLRERRSLTYGAYSRLLERQQPAPLIASAQVRNEVTREALAAFFEHLERIVREPAPEDELSDARRALADGFPLEIDTPAKIASMVGDLRLFGLPDDYWDGFRSAIGAVTASEALGAMQRHFDPSRVVVVVVGDADAVQDALRVWGPVRVVDVEGRELRRLDPVAPSQTSPTSSG
ncbi:MAG: pitrilysin family protein [Myxococcales bacterium]|nr:pitrilysin family protein [Myxococcales bacterium]